MKRYNFLNFLDPSAAFLAFYFAFLLGMGGGQYFMIFMD